MLDSRKTLSASVAATQENNNKNSLTKNRGLTPIFSFEKNKPIYRHAADQNLSVC